MRMVERYQGPSRLDEQLEEYGDSETGRVEITAREARKILIERLTSYVKKNMEELPPKLEALIVIAEEPVEDGSYDFNGILEDIKAEREKERQERLEEERKLRELGINTITSRKPPQPEF